MHRLSGLVWTPRATLWRGPLSCVFRYVHEQFFTRAAPSDFAPGEAFEIARDALLQLHIMTRRGIEPDALMYTSLIQVMGRAGLEWQAYKLFSRMIEAKVRPLPETYVSLRDATAKHRTRLRDEIATKIEESMESFPQHLAEAELERKREEDRQCVAKFEEYMRGELFPPLPAPLLASASPRDVTAAEKPASSAPTSLQDSLPAATAAEPVATVRIRGPTDVWNTACMAEGLRDGCHQLAQGCNAEDLRQALGRLHEEELRIFLSAQRQLRHGIKEQLVERVLRTVSAHAIREMLERRRYYFRSVEHILAADLHEVLESPPSDTPAEVHQEADHTLREQERTSVAPEVLLTPWGLIRKPLIASAARRQDQLFALASSCSNRLERVRLLEPELSLVYSKAKGGELDEIPETLLRRYAFQYKLRWRRRDLLSLIHAVQWHATNLLLTTWRPAYSTEAGATPETTLQDQAISQPLATPSLRLQMEQEEEGLQQTLSNYEAFRVISQRTNNLQVVDNVEVNLHLKRVRRETLRRERRAEEHLRREKNIMGAASLAASAHAYTLTDPLDGEGSTHVLGLEAKLGAEETSVEELPPWQLFASEDEYNLTTGRFGDPHLGRYQELSDSKFRVLPSREAQKTWSVDRQLLPGRLKDVLGVAELQLAERIETVEKEYRHRLHYTRYRKWDRLISNAQAKVAKERKRDCSGEVTPVGPQPAKKRLAQLLRAGQDRVRVSESLRNRFNRSL